MLRALSRAETTMLKAQTTTTHTAGIPSRPGLLYPELGSSELLNLSTTRIESKATLYSKGYTAGKQTY